MKKDIVEKGAILQRDRETYAIAPHFPGGFTDTATLRKICNVADKYGLSLKITSAQRIALFGLKEEEIDAVWGELAQEPGAPIGLCVRSVKVCPGTTHCKRAVQDSVSLGLKMDRIYHAMRLPNKMKMGISGCLLSCAESAVKDVGVLGTNKGWRILVGGNAGPRPPAPRRGPHRQRPRRGDGAPDRGPGDRFLQGIRGRGAPGEVDREDGDRGLPRGRSGRG